MSELHRRQPRGMGEKCKPWTAEEETTWDALVARLNRDHPGRIYGFKTPEEEEAAWDDMNESIEREFPGLRQSWFDKMIGDIEAHSEELVDIDAFFEAIALGYELPGSRPLRPGRSGAST